MIKRKPGMGLKRSKLRLQPRRLKSVGIVRKKRKRRRKGELTKLKDTLWELCKQITRKRYVSPDGTWNCYTSGKKIILVKNVHTGHYIASSLCSVELRYDLRNLRPQNYNENINHSGNPLQFRLNLIRDHGQEYVDELWRRNEATKGIVYPLEWFEKRITEYQSILNSL